MNIEKIKLRNTKVIENFRAEYGVKFETFYLISNFNSIYVNYDYKRKRLRLIGTEIFEDIKRKVQIAFVKKSIINQLDETDLMYLVNEFEFVKQMIVELTMIQDIESIEFLYKNMLKDMD